MHRRDFLKLSALAPFAGVPGLVRAAADRPRRLLVLIELKGGNDGLNTVVPFADPRYRELRPRIAIARDQVVQLTERVGLHPALAPLKPLWDAGELAIVQGVGYPEPNLSHFRSIEIWDTASRSDDYLDEGWLARAFERSPWPATYAAEGVVVGAGGMGPLTGRRVRALALASPAQFVRAAGPEFRAGFPAGAFGDGIRAAAQLAANPAGIPVVRLSLASFDTHANQQPVQANLLRQLGEGIAALRSALVEADLWKSAVVATYAEFGRRPRENESGGTDHGTASAHLVLGGAVRGGLHGAAPALDRLDGNGNLPHAVDFRAYYATFLERWWGLDSRAVLGGRFTPLELV
jgi:uncharacterized protein (DUF1501 family)